MRGAKCLLFIVMLCPEGSLSTLVLTAPTSLPPQGISRILTPSEYSSLWNGEVGLETASRDLSSNSYASLSNCSALNEPDQFHNNSFKQNNSALLKDPSKENLERSDWLMEDVEGSVELLGNFFGDMNDPLETFVLLISDCCLIGVEVPTKTPHRLEPDQTTSVAISRSTGPQFKAIKGSKQQTNYYFDNEGQLTLGQDTEVLSCQECSLVESSRSYANSTSLHMLNFTYRGPDNATAKLRHSPMKSLDNVHRSPTSYYLISVNVTKQHSVHSTETSVDSISLDAVALNSLTKLFMSSATMKLSSYTPLEPTSKCTSEFAMSRWTIIYSSASRRIFSLLPIFLIFFSNI